MTITKFDSLWLSVAFAFSETVTFANGIDYTLRHDWDCSLFGKPVATTNSAGHICQRNS